MRRNAGFTLIELMIAVLIVGILAAVAIPAYDRYIRQAHRSAAQQFMLEVASRAEQYRLDARNYPTAIGGNNGELDIAVPSEVSKHYSVSLVAQNGATPPNYTITATPAQSGASTLTLDSVGNKTPADLW